MLKKTLYICNRCNKEIKTEGTRIIPHFFDLATDEMLGEIEVPDKDIHFLHGLHKENYGGDIKTARGKATGEYQEGREASQEG